jgi:hypothetical protein
MHYSRLGENIFIHITSVVLPQPQEDDAEMKLCRGLAVGSAQCSLSCCPMPNMHKLPLSFHLLMSDVQNRIGTFALEQLPDPGRQHEFGIIIFYFHYQLQEF